MALKLLVRVGGGWWMVGGWWSDKTKVILNSTQFKLKLKLELSLAIMVEIVATNFVAS